MMALVTDRETLVAALREHGVDWLAPSDAQLKQAVDDETLIASLAAHEDPRLRSALTGLFLLQPELALADHVADALAGLARPVLEAAFTELVARYMAAVYLQRLWRTRLSFYLGDFPELPDLYSMRLELPRANESFGKPGLYALAEWHRGQSVEKYNRLAEYQRELEHVLASLRIRAQAHEPTAAG